MEMASEVVWVDWTSFDLTVQANLYLSYSFSPWALIKLNIKDSTSMSAIDFIISDLNEWIILFDFFIASHLIAILYLHIRLDVTFGVLIGTINYIKGMVHLSK